MFICIGIYYINVVVISYKGSSSCCVGLYVSFFFFYLFFGLFNLLCCCFCHACLWIICVFRVKSMFLIWLMNVLIKPKMNEWTNVLLYIPNETITFFPVVHAVILYCFISFLYFFANLTTENLNINNKFL